MESVTRIKEIIPLQGEFWRKREFFGKNRTTGRIMNRSRMLKFKYTEPEMGKFKDIDLELQEKDGEIEMLKSRISELEEELNSLYALGESIKHPIE